MCCLVEQEPGSAVRHFDPNEPKCAHPPTLAHACTRLGYLDLPQSSDLLLLYPTPCSVAKMPPFTYLGFLLVGVYSALP